MQFVRLIGLLIFVAVLVGSKAIADPIKPIDAPPSTDKSSATPAPPEPVKAPAAPSPAITAAGESFTGNADADSENSLILDNADKFEQTESGKWVASGHVQIRYKGYTLTSDRADVDLDSGDALFTGSPTLRTPQGDNAQGGTAGSLRLNMRTSTYTVTHAQTTIGPQSLSIGIIQPVIITGGIITGRPGMIDARNSVFTTCDFPQPHYSLQAQQLYIIPGKRLVGKNVTLYRKDKKVVTVPYFFAPLDQRTSRQTLAPQIGQSPDEGYFAKFAIGYALSATLPGILRLDALQKKGIGLGFEQPYGAADAPKRGQGRLSLYQLTDPKLGTSSLTGTLNHQQTIGTVVAAFTSSLQNNSYLSSSARSSALSSQLSLTRNVGNLNTSLRTSLTQSDYGAGISRTLTSSFDQSYQPTSTSRLQTRFDFSSFMSPSFVPGTSNSLSRLDTNLDYHNTGKVYDFELLATKYSQLSGAANQFSGGVERLPELRFSSDSVRMKLLKTLLSKSSRFDLSLGEFNEPSSKTKTNRVRLNVDLGNSTREFNKRSTLIAGGTFQQGFYGDGTAQYVLNGHSDYRLTIGKKSSFHANYSYLRPYGFTPFQFDFTGSTNTASMGLEYQETDQFHLILGTAYDINRSKAQFGFPPTPWQNLNTQILFAPNKIFHMLTSASYDINGHRLADLTSAIRMRTPWGYGLDLSSRYAPQDRKFATINANLDLPVIYDKSEDAGWHLRALGGYNGYQDRFTYSAIAVTRSWHDYELTMIYQQDQSGITPGSTFTFNFRLKAFPAYEPFGIGQLGQSLDTGVGQVF